MKMKIVGRAEKKSVSARNRTRTIRKWPVLLLFLLLSVMFGIGGCEEYYGAYPGYGPYYGGYGPYGPGYPGSVTVSTDDRPYYTHGPGYYVGRAYYVWVPWYLSRPQPVWIRSHSLLGAQSTR